MATDDERREVAERLRGIKTTREGCGHDLCCDLWEAVYDSDYECDEMCDECEIAVLDSLADLIEPSESGQNLDKNRDSVQKESPIVQIEHECDLDALLALADKVVAYSVQFGTGLQACTIQAWAFSIRDALGVSE